MERIDDGWHCQREPEVVNDMDHHPAYYICDMFYPQGTWWFVYKISSPGIDKSVFVPASSKKNAKEKAFVMFKLLGVPFDNLLFAIPISDGMDKESATALAVKRNADHKTGYTP